MIRSKWSRTLIHSFIGVCTALFIIGVERADDPNEMIRLNYADYHDENNHSLWIQGFKFTANTLSLLSWPYRYLENGTIDYREKIFRKTVNHDDLYFLAIDSESIHLDTVEPEELAQSPALQIMKQGYPFSRDLYALIADRLIKSGAKVVVFDIFFASARPNDDIFRDALTQYRNQLVIGMNFTLTDNNRSWTLSLPSESIFPAQDKYDQQIGFLDYWPDEDGVIRRLRVCTNEESINLIGGAQKLPYFYSIDARSVQKFGLGNQVPLDLTPRLIRFTGFPSDPTAPTFPTESLYRIFVPAFWNKNFQNGAVFKSKIVIIGSKGNDLLRDSVSTPMGSMPGAELHLNAINALLQNDYYFQAGPVGSMLCIFAAGLYAGIISISIRNVGLRVAGLVGGQAAYLVLAGWAGDESGLLLPIVGPLTAVNGAALLSSVYDFIQEQIEKRVIREKLAKSVSRNLVEYMEQNPEKFKDTLGGVRRDVTLLFSDIRGFTTMTEHTDPIEMVEQLNEYLTAMEPCVRKRDGFVDKYIGDSVMAYWGSFRSQGLTADAAAAVECALEMIEALDRLNLKWEAKGRKPWKIGIGLNHGPVIFGNMGSPERNNLTVIGDSVNLAARIESLTKKYHREILITQNVADLVQNDFILERVDNVHVTGREAAVDIYAVKSKKSGNTDLKTITS